MYQAAVNPASVWFCWTEISSRTDVKVEGDKRLDKLESFLDKLHNKGTISLFVVVFHTSAIKGLLYIVCIEHYRYIL